MTVPDIHYARSGDVHIAFQTFGSGPSLVGVPPFMQNLEALWDDPSGLYPRFLNRLAGFRTVTHFDKRGSGLSDRVPGLVGIEDRMDDFRAVMDAAGIERASIAGVSEGGPLAMLFAATYPERVETLALLGTAARFVAGDGYEHGPSPDAFAQFVDQLASHWATPESLLVPVFMPSLFEDTAFRRWSARYERLAASPGAVRDIMRFIAAIDVRDVLEAIRVPTLIIHREGDLVTPVAHGRYLAQHIAGARYVELPGFDHVPWVGDADAVLDELEEFLTGERPRGPETDRVLATVLFTDIAGSTERAAELGDRRWRELLDRHDTTARREVGANDGCVVKSTGDGILASFDSPSRAVRAAQALIAAARPLGVEIRAGVHTGEIERRGDDVAGLAVHVAARVMALAAPSELLASSTVRDLVLGGDFRFDDRGERALKGVDGRWPCTSPSPRQSVERARRRRPPARPERGRTACSARGRDPNPARGRGRRRMSPPARSGSRRTRRSTSTSRFARPLPPPAAAGASAADELADLKAKGTISDAEYDKMEAKLIG